MEGSLKMTLFANYTLLFYLYISLILIKESTYASNLSNLLEIRENTWRKPPKHVVIKKGHRSEVVWDKMRVDVLIIKNPKQLSYRPALTTSEEKWKFIEKQIKILTVELEKIIMSVRRLKDPIIIPRYCRDKRFKAICYDLDVPDKYAGACWDMENEFITEGEGSYNDFVLFVSVQDCEELANAISCQNEKEFNRPVAGRIAICAGTLDDEEYRSDRLKDILMHEVFHILLAPMNGRTYINPHNSYLPYREPFIVERRFWKSAEGLFERHFVVSKLPTVVKVVREHFNCPYLLGADLYNDSDSYTHNYGSFNHFDNRLFPDALLAPTYYPGNKVTKLDMAYLKDSGWYKVNESLGRHMTITRGKGCDFALRSCYEYMENSDDNPASIYPYCKEADKPKWACSADFRQIGTCNGRVENKKKVAPPFRLHTGFYGSRFTSYCPMVLPSANTHKAKSSPLCQEDVQVDYEAIGAVSGSNSICMRFIDFHARKTKQNCPKQKTDLQGVCVAIQCKSNGSMSFTFGGQQFSCSVSDQGKIISDNTINTVPYGCKVSFKICCPNFDVCSNLNNKYFDSSVVTMGIGCKASTLNFLISLIVFCIVVVYFI